DARRRDAVRIEIMGIDDVEAARVGLHVAQLIEQRARERTRLKPHAETRNIEKTRMADIEAIYCLHRWNFGAGPISAGERRNRGDNGRFDASRIAELAQAIRDEDAVTRLTAIRKKRCQRQ